VFKVYGLVFRIKRLKFIVYELGDAGYGVEFWAKR